MNLTQLKRNKMELKRRNDRDIMNQWQFCNYLVFFLHPSHVTYQQEQEGGSLIAGGGGTPTDGGTGETLETT